MMVGSVTFYDFFAVFDLAPLTLCMNCFLADVNSLYAIAVPSVGRLSSVCSVGARYSAG